VKSVSFRGVAIAASPFRYRVDPVLSALWEGGSRALAMAIRQASCELEMVPSLHSNLAGAASATGGGLAGAAAGWGGGAGACAIDF
jgi:hypothetical protein